MNKKLLPVFFLTFVNTIGFTILIPVLPFITDRYGGGVFTYGIILSAYAFFQFLAAPLIGALSDKYGRRPILIVSQAGTLISWIIFGIAYFVPVLPIGPFSLPLIIIMIARIADGITGGNISVANAYIADISDEKDRTKLFGMVGATMGTGFVIGPLLGGLSTSTSIGFLGTVILATIISLITLLLIIFYLPESLPTEKQDKDLTIKLKDELNIYRKINEFRSKLVNKLIAQRIIFSLAMTSFTTTFVLYAKEVLSLNEFSLGLVMTFVGITSIINQGFVVQRVAKKYGDDKTFTIGQIIFGGSLLLLLIKPSLIEFLIILFITNIGITLSSPTLKALLTKAVKPHQVGRITGIDSSVMSASQGIMPTVASSLYGLFSYFAYGLFALFVLIPVLYEKIKR